MDLYFLCLIAMLVIYVMRVFPLGQTGSRNGPCILFLDRNPINLTIVGTKRGFVSSSDIQHNNKLQ